MLRRIFQNDCVGATEREKRSFDQWEKKEEEKKEKKNSNV